MTRPNLHQTLTAITHGGRMSDPLSKHLRLIAQQDKCLSASQWAQGNIDVLRDTLDEALTHFHTQQIVAADALGLINQERADFIADHAELTTAGTNNTMNSPLPALLKMILVADHQNDKAEVAA